MNLRLNQQRFNKGLLVTLAIFAIGTIASYVAFFVQPAKAATPYYTQISSIQPDYNAYPFPALALVEVGADDSVYFLGYQGENWIYKYNRAADVQAKFEVVGDAPGNPDLPVNTSVRGLSVGSDGAMYVGMVSTREGNQVLSIQEYSESGEHIRQVNVAGQLDGIDMGEMVVDGTGRIFLIDNTSKNIVIIDTDTGMNIGQFGGVGVGDGQFTANINGIDEYNGQIYINDANAGRVQVFNNQGEFIRQITIDADPSNPSFFEKRSMSVDANGLLRLSSLEGVFTFNQQGVQQGTPYVVPRPSPELGNPSVTSVDVDSQGRVYMVQGAPSDTTLLYRYESVMLNAPQYSPVGFAATNITENGARLTWDFDSREQYQEALTDYSFSVKSVKGAGNIVSGTLNVAAFEYYDMTGLRPGTEYELHVSATNIAGAGPEAVYTFTTAGEPPVPAVLDPNGRTLTINGEGFMENVPNIYTAFSRSLVTFNGEPMKACTMGIGFTRDEIVELVGSMYPDVQNLVSDSRPCYLLFNTPDAVAFTDNQVIIMLGDDFDFNARGSVIIDGGQEFIFNDDSSGGNTNPWVQVNGSNPAAGTLQLPKRLSFNGKATPGASITVTVRSDPVVCTAIADSNGNWSCTLPVDLPAGAHTVLVDVVNPDASVQQLGPYGITVAGNGVGGVVDNNTPLAPNTGVKEIEKIFAAARQAKEIDQRDAILASVGVGVMVALVGFMTLYAISIRKKRHALQN